MARILPDDWLNSSYLHDGEKDTIGWLADALTDDYTIWTGVEWASREKSGVPVYGEIDLLAVGPSGDVVMIEQKNGALFVDDAGQLKKSYGTKEKSVGRQLRHSFTAFLRQWEQAWGKHEPAPYITTLMYLPDHRVENIASLQLDRMQVLDTTRAKELPAEIERILSFHPANEHKRERVLAFLDSQLSLAMDVGAALDNQQQVYRTHGDRLARFLETLRFAPWRLHVQGAAGSGKTQLAAHRYAQAISAGKRPLYTCFNRPLAERLAAMLPKGGTVANVDHLTELYFDADGPEQDRSDLGTRFTTLRATALAQPAKPDWQFDPVIVDEGQDFSAQQAAFIEHLLAPGGALLWMADARQQIQQRDDTAALDTTLRMELRENFRCGRAIVDYTNTLLKLDPPDIAAGAIQGEMPQLVVLEDGEDVVAETTRQVRQFVNEGYLPTDVAVISDLGRSRSQLVKLDRLGTWQVRRFLDDYIDGHQQYSAGELRVDTVYRFKGLQATAVVYAEIDFGELTPVTINRLYTGMTRARTALTLVVSRRAADALAAWLDTPRDDHTERST